MILNTQTQQESVFPLQKHSLLFLPLFLKWKHDFKAASQHAMIYTHFSFSDLPTTTNSFSSLLKQLSPAGGTIGWQVQKSLHSTLTSKQRWPATLRRLRAGEKLSSQESPLTACFGQVGASYVLPLVLRVLRPASVSGKSWFTKRRKLITQTLPFHPLKRPCPEVHT